MLAQTKLMQPILVSCEAPFGNNLQKNIGPVGPFAIVWEGTKQFSFSLCAGPLRQLCIQSISAVHVWISFFQISKSDITFPDKQL